MPYETKPADRGNLLQTPRMGWFSAVIHDDKRYRKNHLIAFHEFPASSGGIEGIHLVRMILDRRPDDPHRWEASETCVALASGVYFCRSGA